MSSESSSTSTVTPVLSSRPRPEIEDPSSPYYLHPADGPGVSLVSEKLDTKNYQTWSKAMVRALTVKNKICFIDESLPKPTTDPILSNYWERNNTLIIAWILNSITKDINHTVQYHTSAILLWKELKGRFQQASGPRMYQLHRDLLRLHQQSLSVTDYFSRLKVLWDEICNFRPKCLCGQLDQYFENFYLLIFLMGLQDSLSHTRSQLLLMEPLPDVTKAYSLVTQEETQREINSESSSQDSLNTMAFSTKSVTPYPSTRPPTPPIRPPFQPNSFRPPYRPPFNQNYQRNRPYCTHCQMVGHTVNTCFKLHGYPPGYRPPTPRFQNQSPNRINNIATESNPSPDPIQSLIQSMTPDQFSQLSQLFSSHTTSPAPTSDNTTQDTEATTCTAHTQTGSDFFQEDWQG